MLKNNNRTNTTVHYGKKIMPITTQTVTLPASSGYIPKSNFTKDQMVTMINYLCD